MGSRWTTGDCTTRSCNCWATEQTGSPSPEPRHRVATGNLVCPRSAPRDNVQLAVSTQTIDRAPRRAARRQSDFVGPRCGRSARSSRGTTRRSSPRRPGRSRPSDSLLRCRMSNSLAIWNKAPSSLRKSSSLRTDLRRSRTPASAVQADRLSSTVVPRRRKRATACSMGPRVSAAAPSTVAETRSFRASP